MTNAYYSITTRHDDATDCTILGGHIETAEASVTKDHEGQMAALFAHTDPSTSGDAKSQRFLEKMAARRRARNGK